LVIQSATNILPATRRGFIVILALLMLVQFTWAASAVCCLDELRSSEAKVQLRAQALADRDQTQAGYASEGLKHACDVGHCHCHLACVAFGDDLHLGLGAAIRFAPFGHCLELAKSHIPDGLDRPNWLRA
jgi:hypothetical protein